MYLSLTVTLLDRSERDLLLHQHSSGVWESQRLLQGWGWSRGCGMGWGGVGHLSQGG